MSKSNLDRLIAHYSAIAKGDNPLQAHYAMGALDVLRPLKALHDQMTEECNELWRTRIGSGGEQGPHMVNHRVTKWWAKQLDGIEVGKDCGV